MRIRFCFCYVFYFLFASRLIFYYILLQLRGANQHAQQSLLSCFSGMQSKSECKKYNNNNNNNNQLHLHYPSAFALATEGISELATAVCRVLPTLTHLSHTSHTLHSCLSACIACWLLVYWTTKPVLCALQRSTMLSLICSNACLSALCSKCSH